MREQQCLYHYPICPFCRKIRFMMALNDVKNCYFRIENFWERREKFCNINPSGEVPFLAIQIIGEENDKRNMLVWGQNSIISYLRKRYPSNTLISGDVYEQTDIVKFSEFFDTKFYNEVTKPILEERVYAIYKKNNTPNVDIIKIARANCAQYIKYVENILQRRDYIACQEFSLADLSFATHISSLDYLGEINWPKHSILKEWYMAIKSKPAFRDILYDVIPYFQPSAWYRELDF